MSLEHKLYFNGVCKRRTTLDDLKQEEKHKEC